MSDHQPFLKVEPSVAGYRDILAQVFLESLPEAERIVTIEASLRKAAEAHNDDACLKLVELLRYPYDREEHARAEATDKHFPNATERAYLRWREHLERLYWQLPDKRRTGDGYIGDKRVDHFGPTLEKTKLKILGSVIHGWMPELTDESRDRKSTRLNSSHMSISYAVFCLKKKPNNSTQITPTVYHRYHEPALLRSMHK